MGAAFAFSLWEEATTCMPGIQSLFEPHAPLLETRFHPKVRACGRVRGCRLGVLAGGPQGGRVGEASRFARGGRRVERAVRAGIGGFGCCVRGEINF